MEDEDLKGRRRTRRRRRRLGVPAAEIHEFRAQLHEFYAENGWPTEPDDLWIAWRFDAAAVVATRNARLFTIAAGDDELIGAAQALYIADIRFLMLASSAVIPADLREKAVQLLAAFIVEVEARRRARLPRAQLQGPVSVADQDGSRQNF